MDQFLQMTENRATASFFLAIELFKLGGNYFFKGLFCPSWMRDTLGSLIKQRAHSNNVNYPVSDPCLQ